MVDLRNCILASSDLKQEPVSIPEWGVETGAFIKTMSGSELASYQDEVSALQNQENNLSKLEILAWLVRFTLVDVTGNHVMKDSDVPKLMDKNFNTLNRLAEIALQLNKLTEGDIEDLSKK